MSFHDAALIQLFGYLNAPDVLSCRLVCKQFRACVDKEQVWYSVARRLGFVNPNVVIDKNVKREKTPETAPDHFYVPPPTDQAPSWRVLVLRNNCTHMPSLSQCEEGFSFPRNLDGSRCAKCNRMNGWFCLTCQIYLCGRQDGAHMLEHSEASGHSVVCHLRELNVWCFKCDRYIDTVDRTEKEEKKKVFLIRSALWRIGFYAHRQMQEDLNNNLESLGYEVLK